MDINTGSWWGKGILLECCKVAVTQALLLLSFGLPQVSLLSSAPLVGDRGIYHALDIDKRVYLALAELKRQYIG